MSLREGCEALARIRNVFPPDSADIMQRELEKYIAKARESKDFSGLAELYSGIYCHAFAYGPGESWIKELTTFQDAMFSEVPELKNVIKEFHRSLSGGWEYGGLRKE